MGIEQITPIGERVIVKFSSEKERVTASGIVVSEEKHPETQAKGVIVAKGATVSDDFPVGLTVWFGKYAGEELDEEHKILAINELIAYEPQEKAT